MDRYPFLPSKLADYSSTGRPIIAITGDGSATSRLILKYQAGVLANHGSDSISAALQKFEDHGCNTSSSDLWNEFRAQKIAFQYISIVKSTKL